MRFSGEGQEHGPLCSQPLSWPAAAQKDVPVAIHVTPVEGMAWLCGSTRYWRVHVEDAKRLQPTHPYPERVHVCEHQVDVD